MLVLLEEIVVETAMIVATLVALAALVFVLAGFALEHARARRESAEHAFAQGGERSMTGHRSMT